MERKRLATKHIWLPRNSSPHHSPTMVRVKLMAPRVRDEARHSHTKLVQVDFEVPGTAQDLADELSAANWHNTILNKLHEILQTNTSTGGAPKSKQAKNKGVLGALEDLGVRQGSAEDRVALVNRRMGVAHIRHLNGDTPEP